MTLLKASHKSYDSILCQPFFSEVQLYVCCGFCSVNILKFFKIIIGIWVENLLQGGAEVDLVLPVGFKGKF